MSANITDLFSLTLVDGLPLTSEGHVIRYHQVKLRETSVADERIAQQLSERVMMVGGTPRLMTSEADFRYAMTMRHIEAFVCDGQRIPQAMINLDLIGKLSSHDLGLIERRVFLITLAAEVRYGNLTQAEFEAVVAGRAPQAAAAPQPGGQTETLGQPAADPQSGPALLADFVGGAAAGTVARDGR